MALEIGYTDDVDFLDKEKEPLETLLPVAAAQWTAVKLFMNETKTEFTQIYLEEANETNNDGNPLRGMEEWRKSKTLQLCRYCCPLHYREQRLPVISKGADTWKVHPPKKATPPLHCDLRVHHAVLLKLLGSS